MSAIKDTLRKSIYLRGVYYWVQFILYKHRIDAGIRNENAKRLAEMQNVFSGRRCFIIGNGPSLTTADLESLMSEITFASNGIYRIYDTTDWRPTFYFVQDSIAFKQANKQIDELLETSEGVFASMNFWKDMKESFLKSPKARIMYVRYVPPRKNRYRFSSDLSKEVFEGLSVTYSMIQAAIYMGFSHIYLLGIDHSYSVEVDVNGKVIRKDETQSNHFYTLLEEKNGMYAGFPTKIHEITNAYMSAKEYADAHGIVICNATRGGKLELFGRTELEDAISERLNVVEYAADK